MTEADWLASSDPQRMVFLLSSREGEAVSWRHQIGSNCASDRKLRLFACACCEAAGMKILDEGETIASMVDSAMNLANNWAREDANASRPSQQIKATLLRDIFGNPFRWVSLCGSREERHSPYGKTACLSCRACLRPPVGDIAKAIYDDRSFGDMPILMDSLMDAGCTDEAILLHCRGSCDYPGCLGGWIQRTDGRLGADLCRRCRDVAGNPIPATHVRGCWVLDLILGKE